MRVVLAAVMIASLAGPAFAQGQPAVPKYGEEDKEKSPQQKAADKEAERAYQKSLGNIPDQGPTDPWGTVRSENAPKPAKTAPVKRAKTGNAAN
jgi:hypothetical protein